MKEKQYLISESELIDIYTNGYSDGTYSNPLDYRKKDFLKSKQPVDKDRLKELIHDYYDPDDIYIEEIVNEIFGEEK